MRSDDTDPTVVPADVPPQGSTLLRLYLAESPKVAFDHVRQLLVESGYEVEYTDPHEGTLTTSVRRVAHAGLMQLSATVLPDSGGSILQLTGTSRRFVQLVIFSAAGPVERVSYGARDDRLQKAWQELANLGEALSPRPIAYCNSP